MFTAILATIGAFIVKAVAVGVKFVVTYGIKALLFTRKLVRITSAFAGTVAIKAGASATVAKAVTTAVKVATFTAAKVGVDKAVEHAPGVVQAPLKTIGDIALLAIIV